MLGDQFFHHASEFRIPLGNGEEIGFFCGKMISNLLLEVLLDFCLPCLQFLGLERVARLMRTHSARACWC